MLFGCSQNNNKDTESSNPTTESIVNSENKLMDNYDRKNDILIDPDYLYVKDFLFYTKERIDVMMNHKELTSEAEVKELEFGYFTKIYAKHFAALIENEEAIAKLDEMAILARNIQSEMVQENRNQLMKDLDDLIDELLRLLGTYIKNESALAKEKYLNTIYEEINLRDDLAIVENEEYCKNEDVYCFRYESGHDIFVEMKFDDTQREFYNLMMNYELPPVPEEGDEPEGYSGIVFYENGYSFYKDSKSLFAGPGHSMDIVKPTEDQYFGIVIYWVGLFGIVRSPETIENIDNAKQRINSLNKLREYAKDNVILTWIEDSTTLLQKYIDEEMQIQAWKQLNYFGNVVEVYRYKNGFY